MFKKKEKKRETETDREKERKKKRSVDDISLTTYHIDTVKDNGIQELSINSITY